MSQNKTVAVVGASRNRGKYGNKAVRAYLSTGYTVYPVNPKENEIEGLRAYASVLDIPGDVEIASIYVQPHVVLTILEDLAKKGIKQVFFNPGSESDEAREKAESLGLQPIEACSILAAGVSPSQL